MKNRFEEFLALHQKQEPLLIGNAWSVQSASIFEKQGFKAIATSSASVAESMGYEDGEAMSFEEYLHVIRQIAKRTTVPFSVDIESGYGNSAEEITHNIRTLYDLGVCGVNIEDSNIAHGKRSIANASAFAGKISKITRSLDDDGIKLFINIRCDAFLLGLKNPLEEAVARITLYEKTGVHGIFVPCITAIEDIRKVCAASALPVNVMCMPQLPGFDQLQKAGVRRISMGPFLSKNIYSKMENAVKQLIHDKSFESLFN